MAGKIVGHITCPHCGNPDATVHQEAKGKKALYYRCYDGPEGSCGTVQIRYSAGQAWIMKNMKPLEPEKKEAIADAEAEKARGETKAAAREVERQQKQQQQEPPPKKGGGLVGGLVKFLTEES